MPTSQDNGLSRTISSRHQNAFRWWLRDATCDPIAQAINSIIRSSSILAVSISAIQVIIFITNRELYDFHTNDINWISLGNFLRRRLLFSFFLFHSAVFRGGRKIINIKARAKGKRLRQRGIMKNSWAFLFFSVPTYWLLFFFFFA